MSTFCHTMHLCFVTDLRRVNVSYTTLTDCFLTQMDCIYCAVRTESSTIIHANFCFQKLNAVTLRTLQLQYYSPHLGLSSHCTALQYITLHYTNIRMDKMVRRLEKDIKMVR